MMKSQKRNKESIMMNKMYQAEKNSTLSLEELENIAGGTCFTAGTPEQQKQWFFVLGIFVDHFTEEIKNALS